MHSLGTDMYIAPWTRILPYLIGVGAGYVMFTLNGVMPLGDVSHWNVKRHTYFGCRFYFRDEWRIKCNVNIITQQSVGHSLMLIISEYCSVYLHCTPFKYPN